MSVLRRAAHRLVLGLALAATLALVPAVPAAAEPVEVSVQAADLWQAALDWLAALWSPAGPEADPSGGAAGGGVSGAGGCVGDQGMCIDPNG